MYSPMLNDLRNPTGECKILSLALSGSTVKITESVFRSNDVSPEIINPKWSALPDLVFDPKRDKT